MMYVARVTATSGAAFTLKFEADNNQLAEDHIRMVAMDSKASLWDFHPGFGKAWVRFRRHYALNWIDAGDVVVSS